MWTRAAPRPSDRLTPPSITASSANRCAETSFMLENRSVRTGSSKSVRVRSYGWRQAFYQITTFCSLFFLVATMAQAVREVAAEGTVAEAPIYIVALGGSLTADYGLPAKDGFVPRLQAALAAAGVSAEIGNAGVSGDTAADGLARLAQRHITVMLCGMKAAPNLGADYGGHFERIYADLAAKYGVLLYPFFLDGVAADLSLLQPDGLHPNAAGVAIIVRRILPKVEELVARVRAQKPS